MSDEDLFTMSTPRSRLIADHRLHMRVGSAVCECGLFFNTLRSQYHDVLRDLTDQWAWHLDELITASEETVKSREHAAAEFEFDSDVVRAHAPLPVSTRSDDLVCACGALFKQVIGAQSVVLIWAQHVTASLINARKTRIVKQRINVERGEGDPNAELINPRRDHTGQWVGQHPTSERGGIWKASEKQARKLDAEEAVEKLRAVVTGETHSAQVIPGPTSPEVTDLSAELQGTNDTGWWRFIDTGRTLYAIVVETDNHRLHSIAHRVYGWFHNDNDDYAWPAVLADGKVQSLHSLTLDIYENPRLELYSNSVEASKRLEILEGN